MADVDALEALEEIDAATERAREVSDHLARMAAETNRTSAADHAFELSQTLRRISDETAALRILLAGSGDRDDKPEKVADLFNALSDRITRSGGRVDGGSVVLPFKGGVVTLPEDGAP